MATKLAELRSRTNRQLLIVVRKQLDRALTLASVAAGKGSPLYAQAERDCEQVRRLLPRIEGLTRDEKADLEAKFKELRAALDGVIMKRVPQYATCS